MYIPRANEETRIPVLHALLKAHPLAALVTLNASGLIASHIPMVLETDGYEFGILRAHISRANTQWRDLNDTVDTLAIFAGPHHYISPSWYPGKLDDGKEVPTWNYAVVHVYGPLKVIHDASWLLTHLETLTDTHEATFPKPWKVSDAPEPFIQSLLNGIVGLELPIRRLEGKWKVSQNRTEPDREGVIAGLETLDTPESLTMRNLVDEALTRTRG